VAAVVATLLVALAPLRASAHSELVRSDPPEGGLVAVGRTTLTLWFAEDVDLPHSTFSLHTSDGEPVAVTVGAESGGTVVELKVPPLARAVHVLDWRVVSRDDGHTTGGSLLFGAGIRPDTVPASGTGLPDASTVGVRWLDLGALLVAIGAVAVAGRVLRPRDDGPLAATRRRALLVGLGATLLALVSGTVTAVLLRPPREGMPSRAWAAGVLDGVTGTPWGHAWLVREAALVVAAVALVALRRRRGSAWPAWALAAASLVVVAVADSWVGHAAVLSRAAGATAVVGALHVLAAGVWAGSLGVLAVCLLARRRRPEALEPLGTAWRRFSPMAAVATVVLVATGLYETGRQVPDLHALTATVYGRTVLGKLLAVALALGLAAVNTLLVNERAASLVAQRLGRPVGWLPVPRRRFPRVIAAELGVLALAVGAAALLTSVPTGREVEQASRVAAPGTAGVDGLFVTFEEVPAGSGRARVIVRVNPTVRPQPGPLVGVDVLLVDPADRSDPVTLRPVERGRYEAEVPAPRPGEWQAWVAVRRTSVPDAVATMTWVVPDPRRDPVTRLELVTTGTALVLVAGGILLLVRLRRRRGTGDPDRAGSEGRCAETAGHP
jgi:copper transport protein